MVLNPEVPARGLSPAEAQLVSQLEFEERALVDLDTIQALAGTDRQAARRLAARLARRGWLARIRRGVYQFIPAKMAGYPRRDWFVALQAISSPYYLSFLAAAFHYHLSPQRPALAQIATPKPIRSGYAGRAAGVEQVVVPESRFFGIREETREGLTIKIAEPERAVVDCLAFPKKAGGVFEVARIVQRAARGLDLGLLTSYAVRFGNKSLLQRLGYLLELTAPEADGGVRHRLRAGIGRRRAYLGPAAEFGRKGAFVAEWGLIDNVGRERLLAELDY